MTRKLHTRTKIFFSDPYVVRVEYGGDIPDSDARARYRKLTRRTYEEIQGTWGYSTLEYEQTNVRNEPQEITTPGLSGVNVNLVIQSLFDNRIVLRGYFVFKDKMDALQFRLSIDTPSRQVKMWPERWFTIHEIEETDEM